ncbi:MAG TPA: dienelactone hydrolase family protein, partial [Thermoanaerobaculia bacterium]|nr:dienelactone hydrolase family protein [Thermoanaerobaculia bacterium]
MTRSWSDPHGGRPVLAAGRPVGEAAGAVVMVHGRGGSAEDILSLAVELRRPDLAFLAPQAAGHTWYPYSFLAPFEQNEPGLTSGLSFLARLLAQLEGQGVPAERTVLLGFSQGACLSLEFAARNAGRYGGVIGFSGGLIGPPGTPRDYAGSFAGTPVFLGCSDRDPHIPKERVDETAEVLGRMGAEVTERIYPGMGHTVIEDELEHARRILA